MKYLILFIPFICKGQPLQTYPVIRTEQGYLISRVEDVRMLDYYSKNGKICLKEKDYNLELLSQVKAAKIASDSNRVQLQKEVWNLKQKNIDREALYQNTLGKLKTSEETVVDLNLEVTNKNKEIKILKWQVKGLKIAIGGMLGLAAYLIIK